MTVAVDSELVRRLRDAQTENTRLRRLLEHDVTGLARALERVGGALRRTLDGHGWLGRPGERGCYAYDEWTEAAWREETRALLESVRAALDIATEELGCSGTRVALAYTSGKRPQIVCLCGSSRFIETFAVTAWLLEKEGAITLGLHYLPPSYPGVAADHQAEAEGIKEQMDELHKRKIDLADRVLVINPGGYIGDSTRSEIQYARNLGKPVGFLEEVSA